MVEVFQRTDGGPNTQQRLSAVPDADVRAGRRLPQEPPASPLLAPPDALDAVRGFLPRGPRQPRSARDGLHDRQRRPAADRMRPRERGHLRKGKKCTIEAISGQDVFDKRSNTVRLLEKLADRGRHAGDAGLVHGRHHATCRRRSKTRCRSTSTSRTRRRSAVLPLVRPAQRCGRAGQEPRAGRAAARGADRRADRRQPRAGHAAAARRSRHPPQRHGAGQRPGARRRVPDAGVAGDRQQPLDRRHAEPAADALDRRRHPAGAARALPLAGAVPPRGQGHLAAGRAAQRLCRRERPRSRDQGQARRHGAGRRPLGRAPRHRVGDGDHGKRGAAGHHRQTRHFARAAAVGIAANCRSKSGRGSAANWPKADEKLLTLSTQRELFEHKQRELEITARSTGKSSRGTWRTG